MLSLPLLLALLPLPQDLEQTPWPTEAWAATTPEEAGVDADVLTAIDAEIEAGRHGLVDGVLLVRGGRILWEEHYEQDYVEANAGRSDDEQQYNYHHPDWHPYYRRPDSPDERLHTMQSVTKSVTSAMVGVAILRGELAGTDVPALALLEGREFADPDGRKARMTIEDLLTMRSGFLWDEWSYGLDDPRNDCIQLEAQEDWVAFVLAKPMATDPGTTFVYNSGSTHLLSAILERVTGMTIDRYAEEHLFDLLGIDVHHWKKTPRGLPDTEGGLYLRPRDLARIGLLFLRDGTWDGERLLPEGWVARSTAPHVEDIFEGNGREDPGYGYKWWVMAKDEAGATAVYAARGYGGQTLLVVPSLDLIAVFTAWNIYGGHGDLWPTFRDRILPAVR